MTNGDFIRAMDDEALAVLIYDICHGCEEDIIQFLEVQGIGLDIISVPSASVASHLKWLQQEVEECRMK